MMVFMKQKTASEKKKSPFTYLPHPLRLANRTSLSVGPSLPFSCIYSAGTCNTDYEEAKKRRWELLRPGDHLRIRIAEVRIPSEENEEKCTRHKKDEDQTPQPTSQKRDEESRPPGHPQEKTPQASPPSSSVDLTAGRSKEEEEEIRPRHEEKLVKKRKTAGIGLRFAYGEDGRHELEWQKWIDVKKEMQRRLYGEGGEGGERRRIEEEILAKRFDQGLHTLISQDISWALPHLSPPDKISYLPAHLTMPCIHPFPSTPPSIVFSNTKTAPSPTIPSPSEASSSCSSHSVSPSTTSVSSSPSSSLSPLSSSSSPVSKESSPSLRTPPLAVEEDEKEHVSPGKNKKMGGADTPKELSREATIDKAPREKSTSETKGRGQEGREEEEKKKAGGKKKKRRKSRKKETEKRVIPKQPQ
ncbi:transmembrane protein [Cystoisospora suis]|uniref:Transmembrane protein n=1 Tax=Cystoisospora suis TaxID=483139 RepID=A0A2C6KH10_9APIC|nr:transmembrane protein [Cystoisospora suis]